METWTRRGCWSIWQSENTKTLSIDHIYKSDHYFRFYTRFSGQSPQPASRVSRRSKGKEDAGLGDSLSSSFSSSSSSLTSSILFSHHPGGNNNAVYENVSYTKEQDLEESKSLLMNTDKSSLGHGRSYESLLENGIGSFGQHGNAKKQSEAFTKALKKFSSLSNSNISIKLPSFTFPTKPQSTEGTKSIKTETNVSNHEKVLTQPKSCSTSVAQADVSKVSQTISTQTENLESHGLQIISSDPTLSFCHIDNIDTLNWSSRDLYYSTQYSQCYQMYSTLV